MLLLSIIYKVGLFVFALQFSLGVLYSKDSDKYIMTCGYHSGTIKSSFRALKISCALPI